MRFLIIFIFFIANSFADEKKNIKNLVINKQLKKYDTITFLNAKSKKIDLNDYKGNLILLNFWATWCAPCREEMPSLDSLQVQENFDNLKIFAINIGKEDEKKTSKFFEDLQIQNLKLYFDPPTTLAKKFKLRGIPTSILIDKEGLEFARIIGSTDFKDRKFIEWLKDYN